VVALPATCGSLTTVRIETSDPDHPRWEQRSACSGVAMKAVDNAIRSGLEFGGFAIIDSENVNAVTGTRQEIERRSREYRTTMTGTETAPEIASAAVSGEKTSEVRGARFEDATPLEQNAILGQLGAQGLLNARISIGASIGAGQRRTIVLQLQLLEMPTRALVWARRCELEVGGLMATDELAMERAASCAAEGIRAR
jgi:hypothetical protein